MIKIFIVLLNFAFKWRLVNEMQAIALMQAGMQANQLAIVIDRAGNITNFLKAQKRRVLYFLCVIKKVYQGNIPLCVFNKGIIGKTNCYWHVRFFFDLY